MEPNFTRKKAAKLGLKSTTTSSGMFGLPSQVKFCTKCVESNQRPASTIEHATAKNQIQPTMEFDNNGVCSACRWSEIKQTQIDWIEKEKELKKICNYYRSKNGSYDVLIPGSGGKDSTYTAFVLKDKYKMHPLTVTWAPHIYTEIGWRNFQHWIHGGVDNYLCTPNGQVHRKLTRLAFLNLCHPFQPFIFGQKNFPMQMAIKFKIRLIFYGENPAEYSNRLKDNFSPYVQIPQVTEDKLYFGGVNLRLLEKKYQVSKKDLLPYFVPKPSLISKAKLDIRYLGYYLKWIPQECYYYSVQRTGFESNPDGRTEGTYSKYVSLDDRIDPFHYYTKLIKFGVGRATYDAAQEIRSGHLTREEGVALVKRYDTEFPKKYFKDILTYLNINEKQFWLTINKFRPPHLWKNENSQWKLKHPVWLK